MVNKPNDWESEEIDIGTTEDPEDILVWSVASKKLNIKQCIIIYIYTVYDNRK